MGLGTRVVGHCSGVGFARGLARAGAELSHGFRILHVLPRFEKVMKGLIKGSTGVL